MASIFQGLTIPVPKRKHRVFDEAASMPWLPRVDAPALRPSQQLFRQYNEMQGVVPQRQDTMLPMAAPQGGLPELEKILPDLISGIAPERNPMPDEPPLMPGMKPGLGVPVVSAAQADPLGFGLEASAATPKPGLGLTPVAPALRPSQQLFQQYLDSLNRDYGIEKDEQGNVIRRGKDRDKKWSFMDKVGSAIVGYLEGGLPGAIEAGTDRNFMEKQHDLRQQARLLPRVEAARMAEKADQEFALRGVQFSKTQSEAYKATLEAVRAQNPELWNAIEKKGFVDENDQQALKHAGYGYVPLGDWRQFDTTYDDKGNLIASPKTGKPNYQPTGITDPKKGTATYGGYAMTPKEAQEASDREAARKQAVVLADAGRQQDIDKFNSEQSWKTDSKNIENRMEWQNKVTILLKDALTMEGGVNSLAVTGMKSRFEAINGEIQRIYDEPMPTGLDADKVAENRRNRIDKLTDESNKLAQDIITETGKTEAGKAIAGKLRGLMPERPKTLKYTPIKATKAGGKVISSADLDAFAKHKGWNRKQAEEYAKNNGWTIQ
jgi:hypothetical protein